MKMYFIVLLIFFSTSYLYSTPPDSCLKLLYPHNITDTTSTMGFNPDSVMVDSCEYSLTFGRKFTKQYFLVILPHGFYPFEETIEYGETRTVSDISSSSSTFKAEFQALELELGDIYFTRMAPFMDDISDADLLEGFVPLVIYFDEYQDIETIKEYLPTQVSSIIDVDYYMRARNPISLPTDIALDPKTTLTQIYDSHINNFYPQNYKPYGFQSNMYEMNCPLAWEITEGNADIYIFIDDSWYQTASTHYDVQSNYFYTGKTGDGNPLQFKRLRAGHGLAVFSNALADNNNGRPIVGTAPDCKGFTTYNTSNASKIDLDQTVNSYIKTPDVQNCSYGWFVNNSTTFNDGKDGIEAGVVCVTGGCNDRACLNMGGAYKSYVAGDGKEYVIPTMVSPGSFAYYDMSHSSDPDYDVKIITVGATKSGVMRNQNCDPWEYPEQYAGYFTGPNATEDCQFVAGFNFSTWINKFSINPNGEDRIEEKQRAFIDIVAPGAGVLCACDEWLGVSYADKKYKFFTGTSHSTPYVSGIVGLMLSINKFCGVDIGLDYKPVHGSDVQKKVYNILTFTAKKIDDYENFSRDVIRDNQGNSRNLYYSYCNQDGTPYQYEYLTQYNDKLKRSWAQRVGFGMVNAYRAVAHAIEQKGDYEYQIPGSVTLTFNYDNGLTGNDFDDRGYLSPDGKRLMHWGSKVCEGTGEFDIPITRGPTSSNDGILNVLEWGGASLPGEFHNNYGVTKITNSGSPDLRLILTVPDDCILAIDGIVYSEQPNACHIVTTTSGSSPGLILLEGYVKDVEICGNVRVGDVKVVSSIDNGTFDNPGCLSFSAGFESEIYGDVEVLEKGSIYSWGNCTMQPGASVTLNGDEDFNINSGAVITMKHNSKIMGLEGRKVEIRNGGQLVISEQALALLDLEINVKQGGQLTIEQDGIAHIKYLNVEAGGMVTLSPGSKMVLKDAEHTCDGNLVSIGDAENKAMIIGSICDNCLSSETEEYIDFEFIKTQPIIKMSGSCLDPSLCILKLENTILKNVSIDGYNVKVEDNILNCEFITSTKLTNPYFHFDFILSLRTDYCETCDPFIKNVRIQDCKIQDYSGRTAHPACPNNLNLVEYRTGGFIFEGFDNVEINSSTFTDLEYGATTYDCGDVLIKESEFLSCGIGDYDFASNTTLCANNYETVRFGSIRDHSLTGKAFNNKYSVTRVAYTAVASGEQKFRGNEFTEYLQGISASCTKIVLGNQLDGPNLILYGMNKFYITEFPSPFVGYPNGFITKDCEIDLSADINLNKHCCELIMFCGKNKMSEYATNHIRYTGDVAMGSVTVDYNMIPNGLSYAPRTSGINVTYIAEGTIDYHYYETDEECCGDRLGEYGELCPNVINIFEPDCEEIVLSIPYPEKMIIYNDWSEKEFDNKISDIDDFHDALFLYKGLYGSASRTYLLALSEKIANEGLMIEDNAEQDVLKLFVDHKLHRIDNISEYNSTYRNHPLFSVQKKSPQLQSGISILDFVTHTINPDCENNHTSVQIENNENFDFIVKPNPFNHSSVIMLNIPEPSNIEVSVIDCFGNKIQTIYRCDDLAGFKEIPFELDLPSGAYYILLNINNNPRIKKIAIIK